jgi:TatD DNase family protein
MNLIDTHTHLDSFASRGELPAVLQRARDAGVCEMIAIGTGVEDWELNRSLAREYAGVVHYAVGLHPCSVDGAWEKAVAGMAAYWTSGDPAAPVALGECGLDRFHLPKDAAAAAEIFGWQRAAFATQLEIARTLDCPVVVHSRGAFRECVEMIGASGVDWGRIVFHCFSEGEAEMRELLARGGRGSFTGILTYKNAEAVRSAALAQGLGRLILETDAPYLAPVPRRGASNEPAFLRHTADFAAGVFGTSPGEIAATTTANARAFFRI